MNLATADAREDKLDSLTGALKLKAATLCVDKFLDGERSEMLPSDMARLPEPFILDEHLPKLLEGLDPDAPVKHVEEKEGVEWMPDVSFSHAGIKYRDNEYEVHNLLTHSVTTLACVKSKHRIMPLYYTTHPIACIVFWASTGWCYY